LRGHDSAGLNCYHLSLRRLVRARARPHIHDYLCIAERRMDQGAKPRILAASPRIAVPNGVVARHYEGLITRRRGLAVELW